MTYCLALMAEQGLVLASDSRTNAGGDNVSTYRKSFHWHLPGQRTLILMCAGNLGTTHAVLDVLDKAWETGSSPMHSAADLSELAAWVGQVGMEQRDRTIAGGCVPMQAGCTFILAGQIRGQPCAVRLIYEEGNSIPISEQRPWMHIGEIQVAHALLHLLCYPQMPLSIAEHVVLMAMDAVRQSHLSVGGPILLTTYWADSFSLPPPYPLWLEAEDMLRLQKLWAPYTRTMLANLGSLSVPDALGQRPLHQQQASSPHPGQQGGN